MLTSLLASQTTPNKKHYTFGEAKRLFGERAQDVSSFLFTRLEDPLTGRRIDPIEPRANLGNLRVSQKAINEAQEFLRSPAGMAKLTSSVTEFQQSRLQTGNTIRASRAKVGKDQQVAYPQPRSFGQRMTALDPLAGTSGVVSQEEQAEQVSPKTFGLARRGDRPIATFQELRRDLGDELYSQGFSKIASIGGRLKPGSDPVAFLSGIVLTGSLITPLEIERTNTFIAQRDAQVARGEAPPIAQDLKDRIGASANYAAVASGIFGPAGPASKLALAKSVLKHSHEPTLQLFKSKVLRDALDSADRGFKESALRFAKTEPPIEQTAKQEGVGLSFRAPKADAPGVTFRPKAKAEPSETVTALGRMRAAQEAEKGARETPGFAFRAKPKAPDVPEPVKAAKPTTPADVPTVAKVTESLTITRKAKPTVAPVRTAKVTPDTAPIPIVRATHTPPAKPKPVTGKVSARTGMTKDQEAYLAQGLEQGAKDGGSFSVSVPNDGKFTVDDPKQASTLHKAITGKPIEGITPNPQKTEPVYRSSTPHQMKPTSADERMFVKSFGSLDEAQVAFENELGRLEAIGAKAGSRREVKDSLDAIYILKADRAEVDAAMAAARPDVIGEPAKQGSKWRTEYSTATGRTATVITDTKREAGYAVDRAVNSEWNRWEDLRKRGAAAQEVPTKVETALKSASAERVAALGKMQKARASQAKAAQKGGKQRGSVAPLLPEELAYFKAWAKEKGLEGAKAVEDFLIHAKEIGEDVARWASGLKSETGTPAPRTGLFGKPREATGRATGIANQVQGREAVEGLTKEVPSMRGKSAEEWQAVGSKRIAEGVDPDELAVSIGRGEVPFTPENAAVVAVGRAPKIAKIARLEKQVKGATVKADRKRFQRELDAAQDELFDYDLDVQTGKGEWADVGRALQIGTDVDTGDFASVLAAASRKGPVHNEGELRRLTGEVQEGLARETALKAELEGARSATEQAAESAVKSAKPRRFDRTNIRQQRQVILSEIDEILKRPTGGGVGAGVGGFDPKQFKNIAALAKPVQRLALNIAAEGAATLEDVVVAVQKLIKDRYGIDLDREFVVDSLAETEHRGRQVSPEAERAQSVRQAAKSETTAKAGIEGSKEQLATGVFKPPRLKKQVSAELENVQAVNRMKQAQVRAGIARSNVPPLKRGALSLVRAVRGIKLGSDIGILMRQGMFTWARIVSHPSIPLKSAWESAKSTFSEANFAKWSAQIEDESIGGKNLSAYSKKIGLSMTDAVNANEELLSTKLIRTAFDLPARGLAKAGKTKAARGLRRVTDAVGGAFERAQTVFINTARREDLKLHMRAEFTEAELRNRARFINNATGRGNIKRVPESLEIALTSPRYEASRWGILGEAFRQPAKFGAGGMRFKREGARIKLAEPWKVDRSTLANVQDLGVVAASVVGSLKWAEYAGYEVEWNPMHTDFLKIRRGDEVWDVTAGLAPRIRDAVRLIVYTLNPDYQKNIPGVASDILFRAVSPGVKTPVQEGVRLFQTKVQGRASEDVTDPFSGFETSDDEQGWRAWSPLIVDSYLGATEAEGPGAGASAAGREFIGFGVSRYPKPKDQPTPAEALFGKPKSTGRLFSR